jgi:hypothetical protein
MSAFVTLANERIICGSKRKVCLTSSLVRGEESMTDRLVELMSELPPTRLWKASSLLVEVRFVNCYLEDHSDAFTTIILTI